MTTVRELMSADPACVQDQDALVVVAAKMRDAGVGAVPVCDRDQRPVGILTDRDIVVDNIAAGRNPEQTRVADLTHSAPVCVGDSLPVDEALSLMSRHQLRRIPVIDHDQRLIGMLSQADIAREQSAQQTGHVVEDISHVDVHSSGQSARPW